MVQRLLPSCLAKSAAFCASAPPQPAKRAGPTAAESHNASVANADERMAPIFGAPPAAPQASGADDGSPASALAPQVAALAALLAGRRFVVLTGAGCSTESGIPDYRGPTARPDHRPLLIQDFVRRAEVRQRYWARSFVGYGRIHEAEPNAAHRALVALERNAALTALVTQNVDRLHTRAGSRVVVELHGALDQVICLTCRAVEPRASVQARLTRANVGWAGRAIATLPDGDALLTAADVKAFTVVDCAACGGPLKPDVVLFGENVPRDRVDRAFALVEAADALLVVGSSLAVFSGYRFVRRASELGIPIGIVNVGPTRADALGAVRVEGRAGSVLPALERALRSVVG